MDNDANATKKAKSLLRKYKLGKVTLDNIVYMIEDQGYEIVEYSLSEKNILLANLDLEDYSTGCKSFAYCGNGLRIVFVRDDTNSDEKTYALSHELGHICCGHMKGIGSAPVNVEEEREANEFAHYLLHPDFVTSIIAKYQENKKLAVVALIIIVCLIVAIPVVSLIIKEQSYYGDYYVTETGSCYHEKNCIFVKDKKNVRRLTEQEYYSGEYDPCKICLPQN